jgi:hypothetical protein
MAAVIAGGLKMDLQALLASIGSTATLTVSAGPCVTAVSAPYKTARSRAATHSQYKFGR